ncbi:outer membrane homotrimeric porin [uncultured Desulfovibrio sp.]|uniref:outer membrane homotrimeric porin n=1 Tax=uncultured Desulfovibrio sp. TaxID=167968 RepID=UPI0025F3929D|nr:outer membrane homotrimeric porin [uncultured Desulfovibrio sp.]
MKKLMTLALAAAMMLGAATGANAIDFKAKGQWIMSFDYGMHGDFAKSKAARNSGYTNSKGNEDEFEARQRVRLQLDAVASESLSGTVFFEIGDQLWGQNETGGALGADNNSVVELKRAYIDWMVPQTDLKVRMGIQGLALPAFTTNASQILDDDVAAVSLNYQFNENVGLTAFWARPYNDNNGYKWNGKDAGYQNYMDNMDMFAVLLPLTFDGVKVTPWVMYAAMGPGMFGDGTKSYGSAWGRASTGMVSGFQGTDWNDSYGNAFWAGITGEVTYWDPFRIAWDVNYGSVAYEDQKMNREGWLASLLLEYKLDWGTPGIYGWYSSGDDSNPRNGSERMPTVSANGNNDFSNFAFNGNPYIARECVLGSTMVGTWGVGVRLKDVSFLEDLKHTLRVNFMGGTNAPKMAKYVGYNDLTAGKRGMNADYLHMGADAFDPIYLTTEDYALEVGLTNTYKMYDNFTVMLDAAYIAMWLDDSRSTWGKNAMYGFSGNKGGTYDAWNVNLSFVYSF